MSRIPERRKMVVRLIKERHGGVVPSAREIARSLGVTPATICADLRWLKTCGLIARKEVGGKSIDCLVATSERPCPVCGWSAPHRGEPQ